MDGAEREPETGHLPPAIAWRILAVVLAGSFMAGIDVTAVNVALPSIQHGLAAGDTLLQWIVTGYTITYGLALIPAGRLGDRIGHKPVFVAGLALFTVASLACGLAQTGLQISLARGVQGLGAGIFTAAIGATIRLVFPLETRGKAFGVLGAVMGISTAIGPTLGGLIILLGGETDGWRWIFLVNLPIGTLAVLVALKVLPSVEPREQQGTDPVALVGLMAALILLLVPMIEGRETHWSAGTIASLAVALLLFIAIGWWELRVERRGGFPLVPPRVVRRPAFAAGSISAIFFHAAFTSNFFVFTVLWQLGYGRSPLETGLMALPFSIGTFFAATQSNRLAVLFGRGLLVIAVVVHIVGLAGFAALLWLFPEGGPSAVYVLPFVLNGASVGLFVAPNQSFVLSTAPRDAAGAASGVLNTAQRLGGAMGNAAIGSVMLGSIAYAAGAPALAYSRGAWIATLADIGLLVVCLLLILKLQPRRADGL